MHDRSLFKVHFKPFTTHTWYIWHNLLRSQVGSNVCKFSLLQKDITIEDKMPSAFSIPRNFPPYIKWVCQSACKIYHWKPRLVLADCQNVGTITLSIGIKRWRELLVSESRPSFYRVSRLRFYEQPTGLSNATRQIMYLHKYFHTYSLYSFFANGKESY